MKALLICPAEREGVSALMESGPLSNLPILGKSLIEYWLEHLAGLGATDVWVLATDRPEQVRALVGDGARWGLRARVLPETHELKPDEALGKYAGLEQSDWLPAPNNAQVMDSLPGLPSSPLFVSYADWFSSLMKWLPQAATPDRIGVQEIKSGVWAGLHTRVAPDAELRAPCWLGEHVRIGPGAVIGPMAIVENRAVVEAGVEISKGIIGPETVVGRFTEVRHSIAQGNLLANWKLNSCIRVPDAFLLSSLVRGSSGARLAGSPGRIVALLVMLLSLPFALLAILNAVIRGLPALRPRVAVRPDPADSGPLPTGRLKYYELTTPRGWLKRWPQLWQVARGQFSWIGNRPLSPEEAATLGNGFERLWLRAPLGLLSLADAEGCADGDSDELCAHASYYTARTN